MKTKLLLLMAVTAGPAFGWGCEGHQIVALTAWQLMTTNARSMTTRLASSKAPDAGVSHFCQGDQSLLLIARVSTWADDFRKKDSSTANWHFLDVPLGQAVGDGEGFCTNGCLTDALNAQYAILQKAPKATGAANAKAIRFVIHLVGDLHQPLHLADNNDRGGSCIPVAFLDQQPKLTNGQFSPELHSVWDTNLVNSSIGALQVQGVKAAASKLSATAKQNQDAWSKGTIPDWMAESHAIAQQTAYGQLTAMPPIPDLVHAIAGPPGLQSCAANHFDSGIAARHVQVNQAYVDTAVPEVEEQLAKAGVRLATLLNALWP